LNLSSGTGQIAADTQRSTMRTSSTILAGQLAGLQLKWSEEGELVQLGSWAIPPIYDSVMMDSISRVTGHAATLFVWKGEQGSFNQVTTSIRDAEGGYVAHDPIADGTPLYTSMMAGEAVETEMELNGERYYAVYQPIVTLSGDGLLGAFFVGIPAAAINGIVDQTMGLL